MGEREGGGMKAARSASANGKTERGGVSEESGKLFHDAELKPKVKPGRREPLGKNVKVETVGYSRI